jgi:hypothetical protein
LKENEVLKFYFLGKKHVFCNFCLPEKLLFLSRTVNSATKKKTFFSEISPWRQLRAATAYQREIQLYNLPIVFIYML